MNEKESKQIAQKILQKYEENLFYLPQKNIGHFFERAYRMTGNEKYIKPLAQYFFIKKTKILSKSLTSLKNHIENGRDFELSGTYPQKNQRQIDRYEEYKKNPAISFHNTLLLNMFFMKSVGLADSYYKKTCDEIMQLLETVDFKKLYYDEDVILKVGSFAINAVFFLDYLGLNKELKDDVVVLIKEHYLDEILILKESLDKWEYHTFIYNLTHVLIAASDFYEKDVTDYLWITKYFNENVDEIIENTTIDILAEVGLCIKLTRQEKEYKNTFNKIKNHILENHDFDEMLKVENLIKKEHTNSIIMLLFYNNDSWYPGPNLSTEDDIFNNLLNS